jgi:hypothetical protein
VYLSYTVTLEDSPTKTELHCFRTQSVSVGTCSSVQIEQITRVPFSKLISVPVEPHTSPNLSHS